jgi:hypothetical protein
MITGLRTIKQGDYSCKSIYIQPSQQNISPPLMHDGYWFNSRVQMQIKLNDPWMYVWKGESKPNSDIQKIVGYSLDPFRKDIIRLGCNTGYNTSRADGIHLSLYGYFTKNFMRFTKKGSGNFFIGIVDPKGPFCVRHQLTKAGHPHFEVIQGTYRKETVFPEVSFSPLFGNGYNMNPYYEAGSYGAPEDLTAMISFLSIPLLDI